MEKSKLIEEWFYQSDYDLQTAKVMYKSGRYVYCIFMCHLCLEKSLKGLLIQKTDQFPVKTHSLIYLVEKINLELSESYYEFLFTINKISVPTRYPDNLRKLFKDYSKKRTKDIYKKTEEIQSWIKDQLKKL